MKSLEQISAEAKQGNFAQAETDLQEGLAAHPNNAKGWYYMAQVEHNLGKDAQAKSALARADQLDPAHSFTNNASAYQDLSNKLNAAAAPRVQQTTTTTTTSSHHTAGTTAMVSTARPAPISHDSNVAPWVFGTVIVLAVIALIVWLANRRRETVVVSSPAYDLGYGSTVHHTYDGGPAINNGPAPYARPSYVQSQPVVVQQPVQQGGIGVGGALVGGMVAGALLDEALTNHHRGGGYGYDDNYSRGGRSNWDDTTTTTTTTTTTSNWDSGDSTPSSSDWSDSSSFDSGNSGGGDW